MTEAQLRALLSEEAVAWAEREPADIVADLSQPRTYARGEGDGWHEFEVNCDGHLLSCPRESHAFE